MKNYFIANGEILNTDMSIEEIEAQVQATLDENTSGMAQFRIKEISEKRLECSLSGTSTMIPINQLSTIRIWP